MGIGAKVRVYRAGAGGGEVLGFREIGTGLGYASGQVPIAHFGLGSDAIVDVEVTFPNGAVKAVKGVRADQRLSVEGL